MSNLDRETYIAILRKRLIVEPSPQAWRSLCLHIEKASDHETKVLAVEYTLPHIHHWQDELRLPLYEWKYKTKDQEEPALRLVKRTDGYIWSNGSKPGEQRVIPGTNGALALWIPPGHFVMGASTDEADTQPDEQPQHHVTLTKGFWLWQTPLTSAQWQIFFDLPTDEDQPKTHPIASVSWLETIQYCQALSEKQGLEPVYHPIHISSKTRSWAWEDPKHQGWRLPTEAEWEYAARAGLQAPNYGDPYAISWCSESGPQPVAQKTPNPWGLYDMLGNVYEWCWDRLGSYEPEETCDPQGPTTGTKRIMRGGCYSNGPGVMRFANRNSDKESWVDRAVGFRPALSGYLEDESI